MGIFERISIEWSGKSEGAKDPYDVASTVEEPDGKSKARVTAACVGNSKPAIQSHNPSLWLT